MLGKDETFVFINKSGDSTDIQPHIPEVRIVQPQ
ncbi:unnamed protein product, partial [marine sediment metagenome]